MFVEGCACVEDFHKHEAPQVWRGGGAGEFPSSRGTREERNGEERPRPPLHHSDRGVSSNFTLMLLDLPALAASLGAPDHPGWLGDALVALHPGR